MIISAEYIDYCSEYYTEHTVEQEWEVTNLDELKPLLLKWRESFKDWEQDDLKDYFKHLRVYWEGHYLFNMIDIMFPKDFADRLQEARNNYIFEWMWEN